MIPNLLSEGWGIMVRVTYFIIKFSYGTYTVLLNEEYVIVKTFKNVFLFKSLGNIPSLCNFIKAQCFCKQPGKIINRFAWQP